MEVHESLGKSFGVKEPLPGRVHGVEVRVSLEEFSTDQVADSRSNDRHRIKHTCKINGYSLLTSILIAEFLQQDFHMQ